VEAKQNCKLEFNKKYRPPKPILPSYIERIIFFYLVQLIFSKIEEKDIIEKKKYSISILR
jgi:hypothetical protein